MESLWRIEMLGGLRLCQGGKIVTRFKATKYAAILAYLACRDGRPATREGLVEIFWPDVEQEAARNNFRVALNSLRRQLEPPGTPANSVLVADRVNVGLSADAFRSDVQDFEAGLRDAQRAESPAAQIEAYGRAADLYVGDYLAGWHEEWIEPERVRLGDQYLAALQQLVRLSADRREYDRAIEYARRGATADPLRESWHRSLMRLYAATGRNHAALQQFTELQRVLQEQLGARPSATTRELARSLAEGMERLPERTARETARVAPGVSPDRPVRRSAGSGLPVPLTRLFGRSAELQAIHDALLPRDGRPPAARLLTLVGPSGAGKTRLALESAARLREAYAGRIWFLPLTDARSAGEMRSAIVSALEDPDSGGEEGLLVLDNLEQIGDDAGPAIGELLEDRPGLACLVTSQVRLGVGGEAALEIEPLPVPEAADGVGDLLTSPSAALFVDRAQAARPDFQLTERNAPAVADLCRKLEGLPLAIEIAAAWSQTLTPASIVERLSERFELLVSPRRSGLDRRRTLRRAIDWSYDLLAPELKALYRWLSVFRGGWTVEAACAVCGEPAAAGLLWQLQQRSLIRTQIVEEDTRYYMLETLREYASEQLGGDERARLEREHRRWYLDRCDRLAVDLHGPGSRGAGARAMHDRHNIEIALMRSLAAGEGDRVLSALAGGYEFWRLAGQAGAGSDLLLAAIDSTPSANPADLARALRGLGRLQMMQGANAEARAFLNQALSVAESIPDAGEAAHCRALLIEMLYMSPDRSEVCRLATANLTALPADAPRYMRAPMHDRLARFLRDLGRDGEASAHAEEAATIWQALGDPVAAAEAILDAGRIADLGAAPHDTPMAAVARTLFDVALHASEQGEPGEARFIMEDCREAAVDADAPGMALLATEALADMALLQGDLPAARTLVAAAAVGRVSEPLSPEGRMALYRGAEFVARTGQPEAAARLAGAAGRRPAELMAGLGEAAERLADEGAGLSAGQALVLLLTACRSRGR